MVAPKLRFKEFTSAFKSIVLENLVKVTTGSKDTQNKIEDGKFPFFVRSQEVERINSYSLDCEAILTSGDGVGVGKNYHYINGKFDFHQRVYCICDFKKNVSGKFIYHYFATNFNKRVMRLSAKNSVDSVRRDMITQMPIFLPELKEQTKIANFLSAVDERIQQISQTHGLLTQYKKGVMQKIITQELRFKDENGEEFGEWEEKTIADLAEVNPKSNELPERFIYIDLESVQRGQLLKETSILKVDAPSRAQRVLCKNDVLLQLVRPYQKNNFLFKRQGAYVASTGYAQLRAKESADFLYQLIHFDSFTTEVINRCTGTSYPAINSSDLATIEIRVPCLPEQTKIANFLSAIDDKINQAQSQLSALQDYKRGLLQQMFI